MRAVILAGGSGTRLWPLSRERFPKQFLPLLGERSLLQDTVERVRPVVGDDICVVTTGETRFLVAHQLTEIGIDPAGRVLSEPAGRNTAPAIGLAALHTDPAEVMLILPSDHAIQQDEVFRKEIARAETVAEEGYLVTFGVTPSRPETGYGYIRLGEPLYLFDGFRAAEQFVEKPDRATAENYVAEGGYVWNSGMFAFRASTVLDEMAKHAPDVHHGLMRLRSELQAGKPISRDLYERLPKISIDYAVMERSSRVVVLPVDPGWSDLGSFEALLEVLPAHPGGNVIRLAPGGIGVEVESCGNLVWAGDKAVAVVGMQDAVVVDTPDALLVCSRVRSQAVREVVEQLRAKGRREVDDHQTVHQPWGSHTALGEGAGCSVRQMRLNPSAATIVTVDEERSEHWVLVAGTARVTKGTKSVVFRRNESVLIPAATTCRIENPGTTPLEIIAVQIRDGVG